MHEPLMPMVIVQDFETQVIVHESWVTDYKTMS